MVQKVVEGVTEEDWNFHSVVGTFRAVWRACVPLPSQESLQQNMTLPKPKEGAGSVLAFLQAASKLTVLDRDHMRRHLEEDFPSVWLSEATLPAMEWFPA